MKTNKTTTQQMAERYGLTYEQLRDAGLLPEQQRARMDECRETLRQNGLENTEFGRAIRAGDDSVEICTDCGEPADYHDRRGDECTTRCPEA